MGHRWSTDYNSNKYIVTASESKMTEAQKAAQKQDNILEALKKREYIRKDSMHGRKIT